MSCQHVCSPLRFLIVNSCNAWHLMALNVLLWFHKTSKWSSHGCFRLTLSADERGAQNVPYLSNKSFGRGRTHEQHGPAQRIPVAVQLLHAHCSEQARDHHVNVGFHLLKRYIHALLGGTVQEILNATDIWKKKADSYKAATVPSNKHILLKVLRRKKGHFTGLDRT